MTTTTTYTKLNPTYATITHAECINNPAGEKPTFHVELELTVDDFEYVPGDAIGIFPENFADEVSSAIEGIEADANLEVLYRGNTYSILELFEKHIDLTKAYTRLQKRLDTNTNNLKDLFQLAKAQGYDLETIVSWIPPMLPRYYSICSSPAVHKNKIHLLVANLKFELAGCMRDGLASSFVCYRKSVGEKVRIYRHPTKDFHLPEDSSQPILMIGPGTGVAPFRSFLYQRLAQEATGKNWLFFGGRNAAYDSFYANEWEVLAAKLPLEVTYAFSRDQAEKCYVQHRLYEHKEKVWSHLQSNGLIYLCGDAKHMAKSVVKMLETIAEECGNMSSSDAHEWVKMLRKSKQLLADVY